MRPTTRIRLTPEILAQFKAYKAKPENGAWGSLHIVLDDGNLQDGHIEFCLKHAREQSDPDGVHLALLLLEMTKTQRGKLYTMRGI